MPGKRQNKKRADGDDEAASTNPAADAPETAPQAAADSPVADTPTRSALDTPSRGPDVGAFAPPPTPISSFNTAPAAPTSLETQPAQPQRAAGGVTSYGSLDPVAKPAEPAQQTVRARSNSGDNNKGDAVVTMRHSTGATTVVPIEHDRPNLTKSGSAAPPHDEVDLAITAQLRRAFTSNWQMKVLLVTVPFAILGEGVLSPSVLFLCSFLGLIPLAGMLGDFTEDLALHSNDVIGALLNVTFGNATELIISITALRAGMFDVIKLSLIGSVMGNMLLVLGTAFLVGGTRVKTMVFNTDAVNTYGPLLLLSVLGFVIPSAYWSVSLLREDKLQRSSTILRVSRMEALVMCAVYAAYLYFQLVTHKSVFDGEEEDTPKEATSLTIPTHEDAESDDDDEETPQFTLAFGVAGLAIASVLISLLSDVLVATLSEAAVEWAVPKQFIGIILVPIVGNAAEHATAIVMAAKNKLDIAVGVALGSSIQIALFVMPVLVLIGWVIDAPLTLNFHPFLTIITAACVLVVNQIVADGKTNWLEGLMLVSAYLLLALVFWNGTVDMS